MLKYICIVAALVAGLFFLSSCNKEDDWKKNLAKGEEYLAANAKRDGVTTTASGLQYEVLIAGREDGKSPKTSDKVRCHYTGTFIDGSVFDSSYTYGNPIVFSLNGVIKGWTEGIQYMKEGAKYRFVIPYYLAYGPSGYGPIPPYSVLIFEVELIEVIEG